MKGQSCCHQPPFPGGLRGCLWEGRGIYDPRPIFPFLLSVSHKRGLCPGHNSNLQHFREDTLPLPVFILLALVPTPEFQSENIFS